MRVVRPNRFRYHHKPKMKKIVIVGAGGHGREVADILRHQQTQSADFGVLGFVDGDETLHGREIDGLTVLGGWSWLESARCEEMAVICAVGLPEVRKRLVSRAESLGLSFANAISPLAHVSPRARIGRGVMIFPFASLSTNTEVGDHAIINGSASLAHDVTIGSYAVISPGSSLAGNVSIGEGCWIGVGVNVNPSVSIGEWSLIGSGATVIHDVPGHVVAVGVPAKPIKNRGSV
jgi:sugar O-acyltransferase (sialic acid O-acetyltransferase NeuD family)